MKPRPYQIQAVENTLDVLFNQPSGLNPIVAMPTGTGKSSVIAWTTRAILQRVPSAHIFNLTHSKELISQDSAELQAIWPQAPYGIYSASLGVKQASMPITFAGIQSAVKNPKAFGKQNIVMVDEAHMISPSEETSYQKMFDALRESNKHLVIMGYTATKWRMKQGLLTENGIFNHTAFDNTGRDDFAALFDDGYLCPLVPKKTSFEFDVSKVRQIGGDFNQGDLQKVLNVDEDTKRALNEALQVATDRRHWMIFCSGIEHVEAVTSMLEMWGERAVCVHSKMSQDQRDRAIEGFKSGYYRMIVNDGILTTGFNSPWVDCIVLLRPTASPGLHVQILGRGTRPFFHPSYTIEMLEHKHMRLAAIAESEKKNCLVLDFAGNVWRLGPINDPRIPKKKGKGTGEVPVKICPECGTYVHAAARLCDGFHWDGRRCTHEFEFETKLEQTAATIELIARNDPIIQWFPVSRVEYDLKTKPFTPAIMRVKYYSGLRRFVEQICIEHDTYAGKVARDWWRKRLAMMGHTNVEPPPTTMKGLEYAPNLPTPTYIYVHLNAGAQGKYENITAYHWDTVPPAGQ